MDQIRLEQDKEYGYLVTYAQERSIMVVHEDGILRIAKSGDQPLFVSRTMISQVLNHAHGNEFAGLLSKASDHRENER